MNKKILVTGGSGFIGSNFILNHLVAYPNIDIVNLDLLTYAGRAENLSSIYNDTRYTFVYGDICDAKLVDQLLSDHKPTSIIHFAAESHVDRSISGPSEFIRTNILGTFQLLQSSLNYFNTLLEEQKKLFRFVHISTDEVYGSLSFSDPAFSEQTPYAPNSPYSASKASADHLVRSYFHTYNLPTIITNCSNNYGPRQFHEKLIPHMISCAVNKKPLPVYGNGINVRDWLYVDDHCTALRTVLWSGIPGEKYNIGGNQEVNNLELVNLLCELLDKLYPAIHTYKEQIRFVADRAGHDLRYAINSNKIQTELGWKLQQSFVQGLEKTIVWYLNNPSYLSF